MLHDRYLNNFTIGLHDRAIQQAYSIGLIALALSITRITEKNSSNDVAMATIAYASRVLTPQQEQEVDNRLS